VAEKLGEGYIEIFGLGDKFAASMKQVQAQLASTVQQAKVAQAAVASVGSGASLRTKTATMIAAGQVRMGVGGLPARNALGQFTAGAGLVNPNQHPLYANRNLKGQFLPGAGGGGGLFGMGGALGMGGFLPAMGAAYTGKKVFSELHDSVTKGGDMIETMQKLNVVFGSATGSVNNMANEMADKFGSSRAVMLDAASSFGLIGQAAKMSEAESSKMAIAMTKLADDASSFYNVPLASALEKIQAGMVGQSRPLREFGVLINIASVNAKAAEMGFTRVNGSFSESEKVMARVKLITEGLAKAQGDHMRTMDSYANSVRQLEGMWENTKTELGKPVAGAVGVLLSGAIRGYKEADPWMGHIGAVKGMFKAAWSPEKFDKVMGVGSDAMKAPIIKPLETAMEKFQRERAAYDMHLTNDFMKGGSTGPFGMMGDIGRMFAGLGLMQTGALTKDVDKKINRIERDQSAWGGGHVTDTLGFIRQAQENILKPTDETAKEQLQELRKIREYLQGLETPKIGMVLRGRVN
jgi:hypothetical protein